MLRAMAFDVRSKFQGVGWVGKDPTEQPRMVAELALWSAMSDGELEEKEVHAIVQTIREIPALHEFSVDDASQMLAEMVAGFTTEDAIADRIADLALSIEDAKLRGLSYQLAALCAASDGEFTEAESAFLELLQEVFELSDEDAERLVSELFN
jgi:tellurite resistance protein